MTGDVFIPQTDTEVALWQSLNRGHEVFIPVDHRGDEKRKAITRMQENGVPLFETTGGNMHFHRSYILKVQGLNA